MVDIGFPFQFYWSQYSQLKVGSNGWLSFNNVSNIASCFPTIPTAGGAGDNLLAPLMSDLLFGSGSPGSVQYWTNNTDQFVISYLNVPFWSSVAPGYTGSNTFQVILSAADSSITFQYQAQSGYVNGSCLADMTVGIENSTGNIGLQCYTDINPPSAFAIKFDPPNIPLISVPDAKASWNQNNMNKAEILVMNSSQPITVAVKNAGNVDLTTATNAALNITTVPGGSVVYTDNQSIATMVQGAENQISATSFTPTTAGDYSFSHTVTNSADINPSNNSVTTELVAINSCLASIPLDYLGTATPSTGSINWNGGAVDDGVAVYYEPPMAPYDITSLQFYITSNTSDGFIATIHDDDGANGGPGTVLSTTTIASGSVLSANWNTVTLSTPVTLTSGGFYVAWFQGGSTIFLGTSTTAPFSNQNYEVLNGGWAEFRYNATQDAGIRANITLSNSLSANFGSALQSGTTVQFTDLSLGNLASWSWDFGDGNFSTDQNPNYTYATSGNYVVCLTVTDNCGNTETFCNTVSACPDLTISSQPVDDIGCETQSAQFAVSAQTDGYQWQEDQGTGFANISDGGVYSGTQTSTLNLNGLNMSMNNYLYRCVLSNNCGDTDTSAAGLLTVDPCAGLTDVTTDFLVVYPNPNQGSFTVETNESGSLTLYNAIGAEVLAQNLNAKKTYIKADQLAPGVYYLKFSGENHQNITRLVIE